MKGHPQRRYFKFLFYLSGAVRIPLALHAHCRAVALCGCSHNCACVSKLPPLIMLHPRTARRYAQISVYLSGAVRIPLALHAHCRAVALCGCSHNCACVSKLPPLIMLHPRTARRYAQIFKRKHRKFIVPLREDQARAVPE